jgi:hypothetical protein
MARNGVARYYARMGFEGILILVGLFVFIAIAHAAVRRRG